MIIYILIQNNAQNEGKNIMARYKVELIREDCSGCESCTEECPDYFEMADDEKSHVKGATESGGNDVLEVDEVGCIQSAAENCPDECIHLYEGDKQIV